MNRTQSAKINTNADVNDLKKEELFTQKLVNNAEQSKLINDKLNQFVKLNKDAGMAYETKEETIRKVLESLPIWKSTEFANICGEMYKYARNARIINLLSTVFTKIILMQVNPHLFNIGILKRIVKDDNSLRIILK